MAPSMEKSALQLKCRFASNSMPPGYGSEPLTGQKGGGRKCVASAAKGGRKAEEGEETEHPKGGFPDSFRRGRVSCAGASL
ncbi:MAG: hypothetical protein ABW197_07150, partial [Methyloceanibacter sp.]